MVESQTGIDERKAPDTYRANVAAVPGKQASMPLHFRMLTNIPKNNLRVYLISVKWRPSVRHELIPDTVTPFPRALYRVGRDAWLGQIGMLFQRRSG